MSVSATCKSSIQWKWISDLLLSTSQNSNTRTAVNKFLNGVGNNQINRMFAKRVSVLKNSGTYALNLQGGWTDFDGSSIHIDTLKYLFIELLTGGPTSITATLSGNIGVELAGAAGRVSIIRKSGHLEWINPLSGLTLATNDTITLTNADLTLDASANLFAFGVDL